MYDVLIVGAGVYGCTFARICKDAGYSVKIIDKRPHIAGNAYDYKDEETGIIVQKYGAHIFRTSNEEVWKFLNRFTEFKKYIHTVKAKYGDKYYSLPFNLYTFNEVFGVKTSDEAKKLIDELTVKYKDLPDNNLKNHVLKMIGKRLYEMFIEGYTFKQWKKMPEELPPDLMRRIKFRYEYNNDYFSEKYEGIPQLGYTKMFENMLEGIDVELNVDYLNYKPKYNSQAKTIVYCGEIDKFFGYKYGELKYRSLMLIPQKMNVEYFQPVSVVNYTEKSPAYTRIIEHKHFLEQKSNKTIITCEYPADYNLSLNLYPFYTVNNEETEKIYNKYKQLGDSQNKVLFGGVLGKYKYLDMNEVIIEAMKDAFDFITKENKNED